jgi:hypothetical protein
LFKSEELNDFRIYNESEIHADIYKFENEGMVMRTPIDYLMSQYYLKQYKKRVYPQNCKKR